MKYLFVAGLVFLFFVSPTSATPLISDGSLEENCTSQTSCIYSVSYGGNLFNVIGDDWNQFRTPWTENGFGAREFQIIKDTNIATDGQYYGRLRSSGSTSGSASQDLKNFELLHSGRITMDINSISFSGSYNGIFLFYDYNDTALGTYTFATINSSNASQYVGRDINFILPNEPGYLKFRTTGGFNQSADIKFDNIRYERRPLVDLDGAFTKHILENEQFYIQVDYNSSGSCTVTETTTSTNYSTTSIGNDKHRTDLISFGIDNNTINETKYFTANCDGIENSDPRWRIQINKPGIISDGSVEENCTATTSCIFSVTPYEPSFVAIGDDWNYSRECESCTGTRQFHMIRDRIGTTTSDGQYYGRLLSGPSTNGSSGQSLLNLQLFRGGIIYIDFNSINFQSTGGGNFLMVYDYTDTELGTATLLSLTSNAAAAPYIRRDNNFVLPNEPGRLRFRTGSSFTQNTDVLFDNIRYVRLPIIDMNNSAFTTHITENEEFYIQIDYNAGASCSAIETTSGTTYPASSIGGDKYRTGPISYTITTTYGRSVVKNFIVNCNGISNSDPRWKVTINKDEIVTDGSLEENCQSKIGCTFEVSPNNPLFVAIGNDWNQSIECPSCTGARKFQMIYNSSGITTDGQYYGKITSGPSTNGTSLQNIKNLQILKGGKIFMDINSITLSGTGANSIFQIIYDYADGTGSSTILSLNASSSYSQYIGKDISFTIPNVSGYLRFRTGASFTGNVQVIFDNLRYYSPKFSDNTSCRRIMQNGDPSDKIDLVFIGSGFQDQNQFESTIRFVINENGDQNGLFSFEPFKSNKNKFNVWMVDKYDTYQMYRDPLEGWVFGTLAEQVARDACPFANEISLLAVYPRFRSYTPSSGLNILSGEGSHINYSFMGCEVLGTCPYPTDLDEDNPYSSVCDGNNPYCSFDANNTNDKQRLFAHEFGHSLGGLWDEYYDPKHNDAPLIGSGNLANCSSSNLCPNWSSIGGTGCSQPCGFNSWYRAYDTNTLMGGQIGERKEFRQVNENEITNKITNYPTATWSENFSDFFTFNLGASLSNGEMTLNNISFVDGLAPEIVEPENADFAVKLLDVNGTVLYDANFNVLTAKIFETPFTTDGNGMVRTTDFNSVVDQPDANFYIAVPYVPNISKINIYDKNALLKLSVDTAQFLYSVNFSIGYSSGAVNSQDYNVQYTTTSQPVGILTGGQYVCQLGPV